MNAEACFIVRTWIFDLRFASRVRPGRKGGADPSGSHNQEAKVINRHFFGLVA